MKNSNKFSFKERIRSFSYAFKGLTSLLKNEHNSRIHLVAFILVIAMGFYFQISSNEWMSILIVSGIVFITEIINTAIERLADFVEPKWNDKIGLIKDYAAAAVLVSTIISILIGIVIFIPKIVN